MENILQINTVCGIGSTGRIATDLHGILTAQGYKSTIAFGRATAKNCDSAIKIGSLLDNYLHAIRTRLFDAHGFGSSYATDSFLQKVATLNPDLIHLHNLHGYYLNIGKLFNFLKHSGKPIVWTLHDCWPFTGHCAYFDYISCHRWETECHHCPLLKSYPESLMLDRSKSNYQQKMKIFSGVTNLTIVTPSEWLSGLVKKSFLKNYPVFTINNGINLNIFKPSISEFRKRFGLVNHYILLGVASDWGPRKGFRYFIELAKKISINETIVMVGLSEKQIKKLPKNIIGIPKTNSTAELAEIFSAADVFINPTLEDNFPTTNLESLACGTPIITFDSGGSPECIGSGCGLVVERGNMSALIEAVEVMRSAGKEAFTGQCQQRAKEKYNKNDRFGEYINLYQNLLR